MASEPHAQTRHRATRFANRVVALPREVDIKVRLEDADAVGGVEALPAAALARHLQRMRAVPCARGLDARGENVQLGGVNVVLLHAILGVVQDALQRVHLGQQREEAQLVRAEVQDRDLWLVRRPELQACGTVADGDGEACAHTAVSARQLGRDRKYVPILLAVSAVCPTATRPPTSELMVEANTFCTCRR